MKGLNRYPNTATLATDARKNLLPLHVEVAQQCYEWGLYAEGLRQISEFNSISIDTDEASTIRQLFGHKYFSDMLAKDQQPVDFLKSKQLMKFNETLQLDMPTLKERLMAVVE